MVGLAADSGCGKSSFIYRMKLILGRHNVGVICLDDYLLNDRAARKESD